MISNKPLTWLVACALPVQEFGRLSIPTKRLRYRDGFIKFTTSKDAQRILCFCVDQYDQLVYAESQIQSCIKSERLGIAVQHYIERHNKYQAGEAVGQREQILVGV